MGAKLNFKPIIITGFPYAFPYYFRVFEYLKNAPPHPLSVSESGCGGKEDFILVLPKLWVIKGGKVKFKLEQKPGFITHGLQADYHGGHSIRGLFKGWMPGLIFLLPYLKIKYKSRVLYSCSESQLLATLYNGIIAKILGFKHILFTWQNVPPDERMSGLKLKLSNAIVRLNLGLADGIICGNKKAADIVRKFKVKSEKLKVLVCPISGVDTEKFRPFDKAQGKPGIVNSWREKLGVKLDEKLILFYGALDKRKGINVLIDAFHALATSHQSPTVRLVIVGTGPEQENLKLQTTCLAGRQADHKLQTKIVFLDWLPNDQLPALLNAADVFVYPSVPFGGWEEQFGYAMAEASACGVPVVATRTGSIDEVVQDGKSGLLVEPNNSKQLAETINMVLTNDELAKQMGEYGRRFVIENFSHQVVADKISNFLHKFLWPAL